jgi:hypothetical protein
VGYQQEQGDAIIGSTGSFPCCLAICQRMSGREKRRQVNHMLGARSPAGPESRSSLDRLEEPPSPTPNRRMISAASRWRGARDRSRGHRVDHNDDWETPIFQPQIES